MIHQQTHRTAFVKVSAGLLEQWIDGELEIEFLDLQLRE
jgi:hypothetical protein